MLNNQRMFLYFQNQIKVQGASIISNRVDRINLSLSSEEYSYNVNQSMIEVGSKEIVEPTLSKDFRLECEEVRKVRIVKGVRQYLIKWKDLPQKLCSWEEPDKLGAFRREIMEFNRLKKYEIEWMERQYYILNHKYVRKYPLQPFELPENQDQQLKYRMHKEYINRFRLNDEREKESENLVEQQTPLKKKILKDIIDQSENKTKKKGGRGRKKIRKQTQTKKQTRRKQSKKLQIEPELLSYENEIEQALLNLIQKQKQKQQQVLEPPLGYQKVNFEIGITNYDCDNDQVQHQNMAVDKVAKNGLENDLQDIDHYKQFFKGKYSIYHYRETPSESDSSFPSKHSQSDYSKFDPDSSHSFSRQAPRKLQKFPRRKLNLNEKRDDEQNQDGMHKENKKIVNMDHPTNEKHMVERNQQIMDDNNHESMSNNQAHQMVAENQAKNPMQEMNEQQGIVDQGGFQPPSKRFAEQQEKRLQNELINESGSQIQPEQHLQSILPEQDSQSYQIQVQINGLSKQHKSISNIQPDHQSSQNQQVMNNQTNQENKENEDNIGISNNQQEQAIEVQQQSVNSQDKQVSDQAENEDSQDDMSDEKSISQNKHQKVMNIEQVDIVDQNSEESQGAKKDYDIEEIPRGDYMRLFSLENQPFINRPKLISKQNPTKGQNPYSKNKVLLQNKQKNPILKPNDFVYNPTPIGNEYVEVRKNVDENSLTFTQMSKGELPSLVKILKELKVDKVEYVYCLFWEAERQLFEKFIMLVHFKQFYPGAYEKIQGGPGVHDIRIKINDIAQ